MKIDLSSSGMISSYMISENLCGFERGKIACLKFYSNLGFGFPFFKIRNSV